MKTAIQVLNHPTFDNGGPSIILQTRVGTKYIFGHFGEGLQRVVSQNKIKMNKLQQIFLTGIVNWDSVGGLPGFLLTFGAENKGIAIHSSTTDLAPIKQSWRHFIYHDGLNVDTRAAQCGFKDEFIAVEGVVCEPEVVEGGKSLKPSSSYIIQILPSRGKFLPKKAKELGVTEGFKFRELTEGKSVITSNGNTVYPHQVMEPPKTPPRVLVIDCPSEEYINGIINYTWDKSITRKRKYEDFSDDGSDASNESTSESYDIDIKVIYHFLGESINPFEGKYYDFIMKLNQQNVVQYICHPLYCPNGITLESLAILHSKLREIFPSNFKPLYSEGSKLQFPSQLEGIKRMNALDMIALEPEIRHIAFKENEDNQLGIELVDGVDSNVDSTTNTNSNSNSIQPIDQPQIITLGTGSSQPSKYRNVSSTLVRIPDTSSKTIKTIMFDCGEGTLGSIRRVYGPNGTTELLQELDVLYISHLHADHHLGSLSIINEWLKVNEEKQLLLLAPGPFEFFLEEWGVIEPKIKEAMEEGKIQFIDNRAFLYSRREDTEFAIEEQRLLKDLFIETCAAYHCHYSYCVSITYNNFKVSYSGDTRPNMKFAKRIGYNSDLLIHEATHENDLAEEAKQKRHSTIGEAINVSKAMNAKTTILTHFSQRYPKLPEIGDIDGICGLGFDGMQIMLGDIANQLKKREELKLIFAETKAEEEGKDEMEEEGNEKKEKKKKEKKKEVKEKMGLD